jgi:hypothetical protein
MAGRHIERRILRHLQGRVFATLTEAWLRLGVYDTQCGLKLIRADRVRPLLPLLEESGWMLDVEVLAQLKQRGARILEVPIDWSDAGESKVRSASTRSGCCSRSDASGRASVERPEGDDEKSRRGRNRTGSRHRVHAEASESIQSREPVRRSSRCWRLARCSSTRSEPRSCCWARSRASFCSRR